jgi:hypothetical protein
MTNKTILDGRFSLSGKDVSNKFDVREIKNSKTKETMYFERFSTISVARTSGDNPNWDNVPVLIKGNSKAELLAYDSLEGKTVKCQGGIRTSYDKVNNKSYFNVVTGSVAEVTEEEKEERRRLAAAAREPQFR